MKKLALYLITTFLTVAAASSMAQQSTLIPAIEEDQYLAVVNLEMADLFDGPGEEFNVIRRSRSGTKLPIIAISDDNLWYQVVLRSTELAWISASVVDVIPFLSASTLSPSSSTLYISIDTSPGFYDRMDDTFTVVSAGADNPIMAEEFNNMLFLMFMNEDITMDDVRPWLGDEVAIVNLQCLSSQMTEFMREDIMQPTPSPEVVILAYTVDPVYTEAFLKQLIAGSELTDLPYQDITYEGYTYRLLSKRPLSDDEPEQPVLALGVVDDYVVFAQGASSYQTIIDVANGEVPRLSEHTDFLDIYGELSPESLLRVYSGPSLFCPVHDPILYNALIDETFVNGSIDTATIDNSDPAKIQEQIVAQLDTAFKGYGLGFRRANDTFEIDLVSGTDWEAIQEITGLSDVQIAGLQSIDGMELFGFLTPNTLQILSFGNITESYPILSSVTAETPESMFENNTGFDQDLLAWMHGSITMGFIDYPVFETDTDVPSFFLLVVEPASEEQVQSTFAGIVRAADEQTDIPLVTYDIDDYEVTRIITGDAPYTREIEIAIADGYVIMVTNGFMERVLADGKTEDGTFFPDWQLLGRVPTNPDVSDDEPFVASIDFGSDTRQSRVQAAAIVAPPLEEGAPARITIICSICRQGELCWDDAWTER